MDDPDLNKKVVTQIEYYFGDINLIRDKFLNDEIMKNDGGWVTLETLLTFNRLKQLTTNKTVIADAMRKSKIVEVSEDGTKLRRNPAIQLPEKDVLSSDLKKRTVYIKGFPLEAKLDDIATFLNQFGTLVNLIMRKHRLTKDFKGSVYATFVDVETATMFLQNADAQQYNGNELIRMMQQDFWDKGMAEKKARKAEKKKLKAEEIANQKIYMKGVLLRITGLPPDYNDHNALKEFFNKFAPVAYIDLHVSSLDITVRFTSTEENTAVRVLEKLNEKAKDGKILFDGREIQCAVIDGEMEAEYWEHYQAAKDARCKRYRRSRQNKRRSKNCYKKKILIGEKRKRENCRLRDLNLRKKKMRRYNYYQSIEAGGEDVDVQENEGETEQ